MEFREKGLSCQTTRHGKHVFVTSWIFKIKFFPQTDRKYFKSSKILSTTSLVFSLNSGLPFYGVLTLTGISCVHKYRLTDKSSLSGVSLHQSFSNFCLIFKSAFPLKYLSSHRQKVSWAPGVLCSPEKKLSHRLFSVHNIKGILSSPLTLLWHTQFHAVFPLSHTYFMVAMFIFS